MLIAVLRTDGTRERAVGNSPLLLAGIKSEDILQAFKEIYIIVIDGSLPLGIIAPIPKKPALQEHG